MSSLEAKIRDRYTDVDKHADTAYSSNTKALLKGFNKQDKALALDWLRKQDSYMLTQPAPKDKGTFPRRKTIVSSIDDQWQIDLADMTRYARSNRNIKFILTVIDVFSRYVFAEPIKDKSAPVVTQAFERILHRSNRRPHRVQSDHGKEFYNAQFKAVLSKYNIKLFSTEEYDTKASIVERFHRTLKERFEKYFIRRNNQNWIGILQALVKGYNSSIHRSLGTSPLMVMHMNNSDLEKLWHKQYPDITLKQHSMTQRDQQAIRKGDYVRMVLKKSLFEKGFTRRFTGEIFKVSKVKYSAYRVYYELVDLQGEEILGSFYKEQLQKQYSSPDSVNRIIEKVVKRSKANVTVKFLGWPEKFNQTMSKAEYNKIRQQQQQQQR